MWGLAFLIGKYLLLIIGSYLSSRWVLARLAIFLHEANFTRLNYRGESIPTGGGLLFILLTPIWMGVALVLGLGQYTVTTTFLFLFVFLGLGLVGLIDDFFGGQDAKGFIGHFRALFRGRLTSGAIKALYGGIIATVFSIGFWVMNAHGSKEPFIILLYQFFLNIAVIALSANLINLLDLRPGRAGKAFLAVLVLLFFLSNRQSELFNLTLPLAIILIAYLGADLRAWIMMGDVGSNVLGGVLGVMIAWTFTPLPKTIAFVILLALNLLSERFSYTKIIEHYRILRFLDQLGRGRKD